MQRPSLPGLRESERDRKSFSCISALRPLFSSIFSMYLHMTLKIKSIPKLSYYDHPESKSKPSAHNYCLPQLPCLSLNRYKILYFQHKETLLLLRDLAHALVLCPRKININYLFYKKDLQCFIWNNRQKYLIYNKILWCDFLHMWLSRNTGSLTS